MFIGEQIKTIIGTKYAPLKSLLANLSFENKDHYVSRTTIPLINWSAKQYEDVEHHLEEGEQLIGIYGSEIGIGA